MEEIKYKLDIVIKELGIFITAQITEKDAKEFIEYIETLTEKTKE